MRLLHNHNTTLSVDKNRCADVIVDYLTFSTVGSIRRMVSSRVVNDDMPVDML